MQMSEMTILVRLHGELRQWNPLSFLVEHIVVLATLLYKQFNRGIEEPSLFVFGAVCWDLLSL
jgi:hypothetical protein